MRAGQLRHQVKIEYPIETQDSFNEADQAWLLFARVWASVLPLKSAEQFAAQQFYAETVYAVRMRYLAGVTTKMRVVWEGKILNLISVVDPEGRKKELTIMAKERIFDETGF